MELQSLPIERLPNEQLRSVESNISRSVGHQDIPENQKRWRKSIVVYKISKLRYSFSFLLTINNINLFYFYYY
jgi:hypothetical protein